MARIVSLSLPAPGNMYTMTKSGTVKSRQMRKRVRHTAARSFSPAPPAISSLFATDTGCPTRCSTAFNNVRAPITSGW